MRINILAAEPNGIVWASEGSSDLAVTALAYRPNWTHKPSSDIVALFRLGGALAKRLDAINKLAQALDGLAQAAVDANILAEWHKDLETCRDMARDAGR